MSDTSLDDRRRALEEAFFAQQDQRIVSRMREQEAAGTRRESLSAASGITDATTLDSLDSLGLTAESWAALSLVPLIAVAWADGTLAPEERSAVLASAERAGIATGTPPRGLLDRWLEQPPTTDLLPAWETYVRGATATLDAAGRTRLRDGALAPAHAVAHAEGGGFLGLGRKVSAAEQAVLDRLHRAFTP